MTPAPPLSSPRDLWVDSLEAGWVHNYLYAIVNESLDASLRARISPSDVVQQTLLRVHASLEDFHGQTEADLRGWVAAAARNQVHDAHRHEHAQARCVDREMPLDRCPANGALADDETPSACVRQQEEHQRLLDAINCFSIETQQVLLLHAQEGLGWVEIGQRLGRSPDAVRVAYVRALPRLRAMLGDLV